jgi:hypothetical protein
MTPPNVLSVDLDSWVHVCGDFGRPTIASESERRRLDNGYIVHAVNEILNLLDRCEVRASFFLLGEIYDWHPEIVYEVRTRGHEIGYHTHDHTLITHASILAKQLARSKRFLEACEPKGFRAPRIFLDRDSYRLLADRGFEYSSSTYGVFAQRTVIEDVEEFPVSCLYYFGRPNGPVALASPLSFKMMLKGIPFGSGLFFSLCQSHISCLIRLLERRGEPAILFVHPWQLHPCGLTDSFAARIRTMRRTPLALPYTFSIARSFEKVLSRHRFTSFENFRKEDLQSKQGRTHGTYMAAGS